MAMAKDPVCGMDVDPKKAAAKSERDGKIYFFCSTECKQKFDQNPQAYQGAEKQKDATHART
jgi:P-type Cu+ transporter